MATTTTTEKRKATCYGYVKLKNKTWLQKQAKAQGQKLSITLDKYLDELRERYPITKTTKTNHT